MSEEEAEAAAAQLRAQNAALEADIASQDKENEKAIAQQKAENDELEKQVKEMEKKKAAMLETGSEDHAAAGSEMETEEQEIARLTARNAFLETDNASMEIENAELAE